MTIYGYARVSSGGQKLEIQMTDLVAAGCTKIFRETESGVKDERRELLRLIATVRRGDVVIMPALDRLTRGGPFKMLLALNEFTSRGVKYRSLAEPWADTTHELGEVLAALVGYIARKTRDDILARTSAGRARAKAAGVKFGRKPKLSDAEKVEAARRCASGEAREDVARAFKVSTSTIFRLRSACR